MFSTSRTKENFCRCSRQMFSSAGLLLRRARRPGLVQDHDDRLAEPAEDFHLVLDEGSAREALAGVHQIEHGLGIIAHVFHRLLGAPERAVGDAVPELAEEPCQRTLHALEPVQQPRGIAEPRRVPEHEPRSGGFDQRVGLVEQGDMRRVAHFAHVAAQQGAGERRLSRVGVRDEAEGDRLRRNRHGQPANPTRESPPETTAV